MKKGESGNISFGLKLKEELLVLGMIPHKEGEEPGKKKRKKKDQKSLHGKEEKWATLFKKGCLGERAYRDKMKEKGEVILWQGLGEKREKSLD